MRHPDPVRGKQRDLLLIGMDAVRRDEVGAEQPGAGEQPDPGLTRRGGKQVAEGVQSPVPPTSQSRSAPLSARWVAVGNPSSAQAAYTSRVHVYGA